MGCAEDSLLGSDVVGRGSLCILPNAVAVHCAYPTTCSGLGVVGWLLVPKVGYCGQCPT